MQLLKMEKLNLLMALMLALSVSVVAQDLYSSDDDDYGYGSSGTSFTDEDSEESTPSYEAPAPAYEPPPPAPAARTTSTTTTTRASSGESATKSQIRSNNYYSALSGDKNVDFHLRWPHLMGGNKMFYAEPWAAGGALAMNLGDNTIFLALKGVRPGQLTLGMALSETMGFSLDVARQWAYRSNSVVGGATTSSNTTGEDDYLGLNFSMGMGSSALRVCAGWLTLGDQTSSNSVTESNYVINLGAEFSNFSVQNNSSWAFGVQARRYSFNTKTSAASGTTVEVDDDSRFAIDLNLDIDKKVMLAEKARVILGLNNNLDIALYDNIDNERNGAMSFGYIATPVVVGEYDLNEIWQLYGAFFHSIQVIEIGMSNNLTAPSDTKVSSSFNMRQETTGTVAQIGARYIYESMALEASLGASNARLVSDLTLMINF
ncbi:MAG: hypothetical protein GX801_05445 [Fibrobacter sp.]|nr:hypothetical protein [Fibrobacter sp.]